MKRSLVIAKRYSKSKFFLALGPRDNPFITVDNCTMRRPDFVTGRSHKGIYSVGPGMIQMGPIFVVLPRRAYR